MMSRFEYLSVLVSIVLALGVTEVTVSWGRALQNWANVKFSWLHAFWSVFVLVVIVQFWWGFWNYRDVENWPFAALLLVVAEALTLVLCAIVLSPSRSWSETVDLGAIYDRSARPFFLTGAVVMLLLCVTDVSTAPSRRLPPPCWARSCSTCS
jgi:hypothetical protein